MNNIFNSLLKLIVIFTALLLTSSACKNTTKTNSVAAVLSEHSAQNLQLVNKKVAKLLNLPTIILSTNAFKNSSWLILDAQKHKDPQGNLVMGNNVNSPDKVQLIISSGQCLLVHKSTGRSVILKKVNCKPVSYK